MVERQHDDCPLLCAQVARHGRARRQRDLRHDRFFRAHQHQVRPTRENRLVAVRRVEAEEPERRLRLHELLREGLVLGQGLCREGVCVFGRVQSFAHLVQSYGVRFESLFRLGCRVFFGHDFGVGLGRNVFLDDSADLGDVRAQSVAFCGQTFDDSNRRSLFFYFSRELGLELRGVFFEQQAFPDLGLHQF